MKRTCENCRLFNLKKPSKCMLDNGRTQPCGTCMYWKSRAGRKKKMTVRIGKEVICDDAVTCSTDYKPTDWANKYLIDRRTVASVEPTITLRDFFAMESFKLIWNKWMDMGERFTTEDVTSRAFMYADAMLKARERK